MNEIGNLIIDNEQWQQDDQRWQQEILDWKYGAQRLVALLYKLEKALPQQTSKLNIHKARVDKHEKDLNRFRGELEKDYISDCHSNIEHKYLHQMIAHNHDYIKREHEIFSKEYRNKIQHLRVLAESLIAELVEFESVLALPEMNPAVIDMDES